MPYFERKPFAELQAVLAGQPQDLTDPMSYGANPPLVREASAILQKESRSAPPWQPPVNTPALPLPDPRFTPSLTGITPVVLQASPGRPGETARISISLVNDSDEDLSYSFNFTDLMGPAGERIPSSSVRANTSQTVVRAHSTSDVNFEIQIPGVPPDCYFGLATCRDTQPAILVVTVSA